MLLAPFDDRKLLIGQHACQNDTEILSAELMDIHRYAGADTVERDKENVIS